MSITGSAHDELVDARALDAYLQRALPGDGSLTVERHQAGHSNETFFVTRGADRWVLRRPPRPPYMATAHDVAREHRVLSTLEGTAARAPRAVHLCEDPAVIGAPFYLMERVDGNVIRDALPAALDDDASRTKIGEELIDGLAELHAVDWRAVGLEGFGRPDSYIERQLSRWSKQMEALRKQTRRVRDLELAARWLRARLPAEQTHTIVHGDYKLDNTVFSLSQPATLRAILDWEMATIGDPLADLGWLLSFWREPGDGDDALHPGIVNVFDSGNGWLSRAELVGRYEQRTGRAMTDVKFYTVLAIWKLAILLEASYARHLRGQTDDPFFASLKQGVPALAKRALGIAGVKPSR